MTHKSQLRSTVTSALAIVSLVVMSALMFVSSAAAEWPPVEVPCDFDHVDGVARTPDGERWKCVYDPDLDMYIWEALPPIEQPTDATVWNRGTWTTPEGVSLHVRTRLEWINYTLYSGADTFTRKPLTSPFTVPAGDLQVYSQVFSWDGTSWVICKESGWLPTTAAGSSFTPTLNWGTAPCGSRWYVAHGYAAYWNGMQWEMTPQPVQTDGPGATNLGDPTYVHDGWIWDAKPGDDRKPGKAPKHNPKNHVPLPPLPPASA